jgi:hypothetical protein
MTYTRQQVLDHYNAARGTSYTLVSLGTQLLSERLQAELKQMLRDDVAAVEQAQINSL